MGYIKGQNNEAKMTNLADTSRAAFRNVDATAGQRRILDWFYSQPPGFSASRQDISDATGIPLQSVCGRCFELIESNKLESLDPINGRHPLRLKESAAVQIAQAARPAVDDPLSFCWSASSAPQYVTPTLFSRMSMSLEVALRSDGEEARAVRKAGHAFRVWGDENNLKNCAAIDEIVSRKE